MGKREILYDDLDKTEGNVEVVRFGYNGSDYVIELGPKNLKKLDDFIRPYVDAARTEEPELPRVPRGVGRPRTRTEAGSSSGSGDSKEQLAAIRTWARAAGHTVGDKGRISQTIRDAFEAAHQE
jgi:hypothetical protein